MNPCFHFPYRICGSLDRDGSNLGSSTTLSFYRVHARQFSKLATLYSLILEITF